jgi:hypothetical protein
MLEKLKTTKGVLLAVLVGLLLWTVSATPHWIRVIQAVQVYLYGYPLVIMGVTKDVTTAPEVMQVPVEKRKLGAGIVNQFSHIRKFPDHSFKDVVAPNADTLYSTAWLDLSKGPQVLRMPDMHGRWVLMEVMDAWTNAYASLGTRQYGGGKRDYLITGPDWRGEVPNGMTHVKSPTNMGWILGRTYTKNEADYPNVHRFQNQYLLEPFKEANTTSTEPSPVRNVPVDIVTPPVRQMAALDAKSFYTRLTQLMVNNRPDENDASILRKLERFGIKVGEPLQWDAIDASAKAELEEGLELSRGFFEGFAPGTQGELHLSPFTKSVVDFLAKRIRSTALAPVNGWGISMNLGMYGTNYPLRALVSLIGLGANVADDALYPVTTIDADGVTLDGKNRYVLHFSKDEVPPAAAFWSLSMYDNESFFVDNAIRRYAIGDRDTLKFNADGSLDLWIQKDMPEDAKRSNWLPAAQGPFRLMLRLYDPKPVVLNGQWKPPAVQKIPG